MWRDLIPMSYDFPKCGKLRKDPNKSQKFEQCNTLLNRSNTCSISMFVDLAWLDDARFVVYWVMKVLLITMAVNFTLRVFEIWKKLCQKCKFSFFCDKLKNTKKKKKRQNNKGFWFGEWMGLPSDLILKGLQFLSKISLMSGIVKYLLRF